MPTSHARKLAITIAVLSCGALFAQQELTAPLSPSTMPTEVGTASTDTLTSPPPLPSTTAPVARSPEEIAALVAPVALYPDALLAQVLMASTFPLQVVEANRWVQANPNLPADQLADALNQKTWDPSVKSLVNTPTVLQLLDDQLDNTIRLGETFAMQQGDVMDSVQRLRVQAQAAGTLQTNQQQRITYQSPGPEVAYAPQAAPSPEPQIIVIEQSDPTYVYVPVYDPVVVYGTWRYASYRPAFWHPREYRPTRGIWYGEPVRCGPAWGYAWGRPDWHHRDVDIDVHRNNTLNPRLNPQVIGRELPQQTTTSDRGGRTVFKPRTNPRGNPNTGGPTPTPMADEIRQRLADKNSTGPINRAPAGADRPDRTARVGPATPEVIKRANEADRANATPTPRAAETPRASESPRTATPPRAPGGTNAPAAVPAPLPVPSPTPSSNDGNTDLRRTNPRGSSDGSNDSPRRRPTAAAPAPGPEVPAPGDPQTPPAVPVPTPSPSPKPVPPPAPAPSDPTPPTPPTPAPAPKPRPIDPDPTPSPRPNPTPAPKPIDPDPTPAPRPRPSPSPAPAPVPAPMPVPAPTPAPMPQRITPERVAPAPQAPQRAPEPAAPQRIAPPVVREDGPATPHGGHANTPSRNADAPTPDQGNARRNPRGN